MLTQKRVKELYNYNGTNLIRNQSRNGQKSGTEPGFESSGGYRQLSVDGTTYMYHHIVWLWETGKLPAMEIDHIDRNKTNNSISNLRECSSMINSQNRPLRSDNKSGINGVYKFRNKWKAMIRINKILKYLGLFNTIEEATAARMAAEQEHGFHENHGR